MVRSERAARRRRVGRLHPQEDQGMRALRPDHLAEHAGAQRRLLPAGMETRGRPLAPDGRRPALPAAGGDRRHSGCLGQGPRPISRAAMVALAAGREGGGFRRARAKIVGERRGERVHLHPDLSSDASDPMRARPKTGIVKWLVVALGGIAVAAIAGFIAFRAPPEGARGDAGGDTRDVCRHPRRRRSNRTPSLCCRSPI